MRAVGRSRLLSIIIGIGFFCSASAEADLRLIDQYERPVNARALSGRWLLVYFGYASCREICPAALITMTQLLTRLGPLANSIDPLFITLDPGHDSPEVLRDFLTHFDPRIRGLTGSTQAVADAAHAFEVPWKSTFSGAVSDHGALFYLVAPDGRVLQMLHPQQPIDDLVAAVAKRIESTSKS